MITLRFEGIFFEWRGPAPFYFVATPTEISEEIKVARRELSYGWGVVPVTIIISKVKTTTALIPKDGGYLVPLKDVLRKSNQIEVGDQVSIELNLGN